MSEHGCAVFNNSCLRVPRNPVSKAPLPVYDQKLMNQLENEARKLGSKSEHRLRSLIDFYDSIPEYNEVNHLSNKEFYKKLENLRQKQRSYNNYLCCEEKIESRQTGWIDDYKTLSTGRTPDSERKCSGDEEWESKPPSRRSVRIETPPTEIPSKSRCESAETRSAPSSPRKVAWKDCGITIPQPFQMTIRDEENRIVDEILIKTTKPEAEKKFEMFKAHPVPIESQIPLFDKIMHEQEQRSKLVKKRSKDHLKAQMRPFSFTRREEDIKAITKRLSKSSPSIFAEIPDSPKPKQFKAKPIPKNLFSNYVYQRMHEDEFYRSLQKKIRAEEMLKAASLPPAMAKREKSKPRNQQMCPRSFRDLYLSQGRDGNLDKQLAELELDFVLRTPTPMAMKKKARRSSRKSPGDQSRCRSVLESTNRSNLAAVLRQQSSKKRMEDEICRRLEEVRIKEEARWREKVMRRKPVWQTLVYSHEEDLQMRLQLRKDEEKLRQEEHKFRMQRMLGRVNKQPTLFERQSQIKNAKTREELIARLYGNLGKSASSSSKLSSDESEVRSVIEMKDEAIQAQFDDFFEDEIKAAIEGSAENAED